jgi:hypothetical protein
MKSFYQLIKSIRCLGLSLGLRYWNLQRKAAKNPCLIPIWCEAWLAGAKKADEEGDPLYASLLRDWVKLCKQPKK